MKCSLETQRKYWKYTYQDHTLPKMTSETTPEGSVISDYSMFESNPFYYVFFNQGQITYNCYAGSGNKTATYTFDKPLKSGTYSLSYYGKKQANNVTSSSHKWIAVLEDNTDVEITSVVSYTTGGTTYSGTITTNQRIKALRYDCVLSSKSTYHNEYISQLKFTMDGKSENVVSMTSGYIESTESDYDFYTDGFVARLPKISDKFYCINQ